MQSLVPKDGHLRQPVKTVFDPETGYVVVQIDKAEYGYREAAVRYQGRVFQPKTELHITIVSADSAEAVRTFMEHNPDNAFHVQEFIDETRWSYRPLDSFYHIAESPEVETIIQMVELPYIEDFFSRLSGLVGQGFVLPPTHVTLYMRGTEKGIGIPTPTVFDQLVQGSVRPQEIVAEQTEPGMGAAQP